MKFCSFESNISACQVWWSFYDSLPLHKTKDFLFNIIVFHQKYFINRRTSTDEFALLGVDNSCQDYFNDFGAFLDKKISEFEGQFWNDPDWFFGGIWPEQGFDPEVLWYLDSFHSILIILTKVSSLTALKFSRVFIILFWPPGKAVTAWNWQNTFKQ